MAVIDVGWRALRAHIDEYGRSALLRGRATAIPAASTMKLPHGCIDRFDVSSRYASL